MRIHFDGAAQTVTGSQHLIEVNGQRLLLECGMYQGKRQLAHDINCNLPYDAHSVDAVILSHAHIDHSGNLPNLIKNGYEGPIYTTPATAALANIMLLDSGHIQEADVAYANKKQDRRGEPPSEPIYTLEDAAHVNEHFSPVEYNVPFQPVKGVTATLFDAGHILGSAGVLLEVEENGRTTRLWFSGDIGRQDMPLMRDPVLPQQVDYLMMECTYGDSVHGDPEAAYATFRDVVKRTVNRGGKIIVPAFAVGRTQELVYNLNRMISENEIAPLPVYVDSPLAVNASRIFQQFSNLFDEETQQFIKEERHPALNFKGLTYINSVDESKALNNRHDPMVIISASGMAETGRILHHLRNNIENPRNTILLVSYTAPDTLGRRLAEGAPQVRIFGQLFDVKAEVASINGLSAHAGQDMLLKYAQAAQGHLKEIILVHGEQGPADTFTQKLKEAGLGPVMYPAKLETMDI